MRARTRPVAWCARGWRAIGPTGETERARGATERRGFSGGDRPLRAVPSWTDHPSRPAYAGHAHGPSGCVLTYTFSPTWTGLHLHTCAATHHTDEEHERARSRARASSRPRRSNRQPRTKTIPLMNEPTDTSDPFPAFFLPSFRSRSSDRNFSTAGLLFTKRRERLLFKNF